MENKHLLIVLYDSVTNSVFVSQVLEPLVRMHQNNLAARATIVTFESDVDGAQRQIAALAMPSWVGCVVLKRLPLIGLVTLAIGMLQLRWAIRKKRFDGVRARGPLAGLIVRCLGFGVPVVVQARGLCAEEYRFVCEQQPLSFMQKMVAWWRKKIFDAVERRAYAWHPTIIIEGVSPALGDFLCDQYGTNRNCLLIAQHDLVAPLAPAAILQQRDAMRAALSIPNTARVYCYSGSSKPWQCAEETVAWFADEAVKDRRAFLIIFSQDTLAFEKLAQQYALPVQRFLIMRVAPAELVQSLCVADVGILLRKPDVVNWVSRPTKLLEYRAAGLEIMHNDTIQLLAVPGQYQQTVH
jgi:hypothetical protein